MFVLTLENASSYLAERGWPASTVQTLGGGVSNTVLLVTGPRGRVVCKQALEKLRVETDWRSRPDRTLREADAIQAVARLLPAGTIPDIVFIDRPNCIYAMTAAPEGCTDWKTALLGGVAETATAAAAGRILGSIIRATWHQPDWELRFGDQTVFDELRLDPYYRYTAARHPDCAAHFERLIQSCQSRRVSLVHGDWSPKNLLTHGCEVMAIDFEVVHYGDPCFDTGFLLCHLLMKSIHQPALAGALLLCAEAFWNSLAVDAPWLWQGTMAHLGGLLLARADGKSPAEYLNEPQRTTLRRLAKQLIHKPQDSIKSTWQCL